MAAQRSQHLCVQQLGAISTALLQIVQIVRVIRLIRINLRKANILNNRNDYKSKVSCLSQA